MKWPLFLPMAAIVASFSLAQESVRRHFEAGQKHQASGEFTLAESEYRQALGIALEQLGALSTDQRMYDQALRAYREAAEARANSDDALLGQAIVHLLQKNPQTGIELVSRVLSRDPGNSNARHVLGKLLMLEGRFKEAVAELEDVVARNPSDLGAAYTLALVYLEDKQIEPAQAIFAKLLQSLGDSPEMRTLIGRAYKEMRFLDQAVDSFRKAIELNPQTPRALFYLGQTLLIREGTSRIPDAIELFRKALLIEPDDFQTNFLLGIALRETRDFVRAVAALERAVQANPGSADAHHYLGSALYQSGLLTRAESTLKKAIALTTDPSRSDYQVANTHYILSQVYRKLGKEEPARKEIDISSGLKSQSAAATVDSLESFLATESSNRQSGLSMEGKEGKGAITIEIDLPSRLHPKKALPIESEILLNVATVYNAIGLLRASQNDFARAAALFERAQGWKGDLKDLAYNLGLTYYMMKAFDRALPHLEKELGAKVPSRQARHLAALCYFETGNFQKAIPLIQQVLQLKPRDPQLSTALAISFLRTERGPEAERILRPLIREHPDQGHLHLLLGQALAQRGSYPEAAAAFRDAARLQPKLPDVSFMLGMALLRANQFEAAEEAFRRELMSGSEHPRARYHLGYLLLMQHKVEEGLAELQRVVAADPRYAEAHYQLGKSYLQQGKLEDARSSLERAALLDADKDYIHYQLAQAYLRLGKESEAQREMEVYRNLKARQRERTLRDAELPPEAGPRPSP